MNPTSQKLRRANVLMITGDRNFKPGHPRYDLQRAAVDTLEVVYWGRGALWPRIPSGTFDFVTAQDPRWRGLLGWAVARMKGAKLNIQVHGDIALSRKYFTFVLRRADSIRVVSEKIKVEVEKIGARVPVTVLPIYKDVSEFKKIVREPHVGKTILWIGRFEPEKNPGAAVEVLKGVQTKMSDTKLVMLGSGSMKKYLHALAKGLPVEFPGWRGPKLYLSTADVVLCTSWHESWGESIIEALAVGIPVVAPDIGVAKEAGATVVPRERLTEAVIEALHSGKRGELKLKLLSRDEWINRWRESLL